MADRSLAAPPGRACPEDEPRSDDRLRADPGRFRSAPRKRQAGRLDRRGAVLPQLGEGSATGRNCVSIDHEPYTGTQRGDLRNRWTRSNSPSKAGRELLKAPQTIKPVAVATGLNPADLNANWQNVESSCPLSVLGLIAGLFCSWWRGAVSLHTREVAGSSPAVPIRDFEGFLVDLNDICPH